MTRNIILTFVCCVLAFPAVAFSQNLEVVSVRENGKAVVRDKITNRESELAVDDETDGWKVKKVAKRHVVLTKTETGNVKHTKVIPVSTHIKTERMKPSIVETPQPEAEKEQFVIKSEPGKLEANHADE